jgi:hypothetical protein
MKIGNRIFTLQACMRTKRLTWLLKKHFVLGWGRKSRRCHSGRDPGSVNSHLRLVDVRDRGRQKTYITVIACHFPMLINGGLGSG